MYRWMMGCGVTIGLLAFGQAPLHAATEAAPATVHTWMNGAVIPNSTLLWDLASKAFDDDGKPDASKISASDWAKVAEAAQAIRSTAGQMAEARAIVAAPAGVKLVNEGVDGGSTPAQVQRFVDRDRPGFNKFARELAANAGEFAEAARTRNAQRLSDASDALEGVCEACHTQFWYPQQAAAEAR